MRVFSLALLATFIFFLSPSFAHAACALKGREAVHFVSLDKDGTIKLADGRSLRLSGIEAPPQGAQFEAAAKHIAALADQAVALRPAVPPQDRYGRLQGLVFGADGHLIAGDLVSAGWVRVNPRADMRDCVADLLALESKARAAKRGLWRDGTFRPVEATALDVLKAREGTFQLVEGQVVDQINKQGRLYINFGDDWRTDFTVTVAPADARLFANESWMIKGGKESSLIGQRIRVRGYLVRYNGPEMVLTCPEQLEVLTVQKAKESEKAAKTERD